MCGTCVSNVFKVADMGKGDCIVPDETLCQERIQTTSCYSHVCQNIALICLNVTFLYTKLFNVNICSPCPLLVLFDCSYAFFDSLEPNLCSWKTIYLQNGRYCSLVEHYSLSRTGFICRIQWICLTGLSRDKSFFENWVGFQWNLILALLKLFLSIEIKNDYCLSAGTFHSFKQNIWEYFLNCLLLFALPGLCEMVVISPTGVK